MDPSFGARLRARREQQQVALADIAEQTKIKLSLLAALERDDVSQWPSGIFRRSYVRSYARAIGLEPDAILREFLERYPDPVDESAALPATVPDGQATGRRPPTRLRFLIASAIEALPVRRAPSSQLQPAAAPATTAADSGMDDYGPFLAAQPEAPMAAAHEWTGECEGAACAPPPPAVDEQLPLPGIPIVEAAIDAPAPVRPVDPLAELAALCARIARTADPAEFGPVFESAASLLDALGVILWMATPQGSALRPALGHGYSNDTLARLGGVSRDADNALATAFRTGETRVVNSSAEETGAIVVPLITPVGCAGVLAFELRDGREPGEPARAFAAIIAAQLAALVG